MHKLFLSGEMFLLNIILHIGLTIKTEARPMRGKVFLVVDIPNLNILKLLTKTYCHKFRKILDKSCLFLFFQRLANKLNLTLQRLRYDQNQMLMSDECGLKHYILN